jgi:choloylglycine hydrolase
MTNSPIFEEQLALNTYWQQIGGTVMLPGTNRAADRFARASFYVNAIPKDQTPNKNLASVFSVIRNASVPYGISTPGNPIFLPPAGVPCSITSASCISLSLH